ncbi:MAG: ATP-binding protein [Nitrospirota bacterium]|nr:ATP-binding protein [Nitrospirota bacterium]
MEDISLHILDVAENSIGAGASLIRITLSEITAEDLFSLEIEDNGRGMPEDIMTKVLDPFYTTRTTRKVGLGLPLLAQSARETGGDISVRAGDRCGTIVTACFKKSHIDMKPLGDITETLVVLIAGNPQVDFLFTYRINSNEFSLDTREVRKELGSVPITTPDVLSFLRDYLRTSLRDINSDIV